MEERVEVRMSVKELAELVAARAGYDNVWVDRVDAQVKEYGPYDERVTVVFKVRERA